VWYRRKRNTLRTDPGGTSDSATKARADKETNGHAHPTGSTEKEALPSKVKEAVTLEKQCVVHESLPKEAEKTSVEQEAVPKPSVVQEAVPKPVLEEKVVVEKAVPKEKEPVSAVQEEKVVVEKAVPEEPVPVVQEEKVIVPKEPVPVVQEEEKAVPREEEPVPKPVVQEEKVVVEEAVPKPVVQEEKVVVEEAVSKPCVVQGEKVEKQMGVKKAGSKKEKRRGQQEAVSNPGVQEELAKEAGPKEAVEQVVVKKAVPKEGKKPRGQEALPEKSCAVQGEQKVGAMSEEEASEGAAGGAAAALQEEKVGPLGGKLASLSLEEQRCVADADRDSANHSPVDAMLASPSLSNYSDEHSEVSTRNLHESWNRSKHLKPTVH